MPRYTDADVSVRGGGPAQVHKIDRLCVYLADCNDGQRHLPPTLDCRHMISILASEAVDRTPRT